MADKSINELVAASSITPGDLFVLEQNATAKKLTGQVLINFLTAAADGHGGISSITKTGTSGLTDTYTITYADTSTQTFSVTNGAKGDTGAAWYVWIRYAAARPSSDAQMGTTPDNWMGIYTGTSSTAPIAYTSYAWFQIKGAKGDTGTAASITSQTVTYQASISGTVVPTGTWQSAIPTVSQGNYLWTRTVITFNDNTSITSYSVGRMGIDGQGSPATAPPLMDGTAAVGFSANFAREDHVHPTDATRAASVHALTHATGGADPITPANIGAEKQRLQFTNTNVPIAAFKSDTTYTDFPYRATVPLTGVLASMTPEVIFGVTDAASGIYAPVAECYAGGVYIYAASVPEAAITIPTIICWKAVS